MMRLLLLSPCFYTQETTTTSADYYSTTTESYNYDDLPKDISDIFDNFEATTEQQLIDIENLMTSHTPLTLKNGKRRNNSKTSPSGIAARSELNGTFFEDDLELIIGRKKFLVYGEYAGGFSNFDRGEELDQGDEVDREVKDRISNNQWNKKNQEGRGHGVGPGFGNIGKGSESLNSDLVRFQKYKMTKSMVMYLQGENTQFGRYVGYGCWCLLGADFEMGEPSGEPVDAIDRACRQFHNCQRCLEIDEQSSSGERDEELSCNRFRGYRFNGIEGKTGERRLQCNNQKGSCQRTACQCDKQLAMTLQGLEETWNVNHHMMWGGFDRAEKCQVRQTRAQPRPDACCGEPEHRFPYSSFDGMRGCCEQKTFWKPESCCKGGKVLSKDQCPEDSEDKEGFTHREMTKV